MSITLFTATGCPRCKIVMSYMTQKGIVFEAKDIKAEGKKDFQNFYKENRTVIFRGPEGVEFPIYFQEGLIRQGLGPVIAYLQSGNRLDAFVRTGILHGEWVDGINISGGDAEAFEDLTLALAFLKKNGLKLELETNGKNPEMLQNLLDRGLGDRVIMNLPAPKGQVHQVSRLAPDTAEVEKTMAIVPGFPEYLFRIVVAPLKREGGQYSYLTPDEAGEIASWLKDVTGDMKHPFHVCAFNPKTCDDPVLKEITPLAGGELFKYRTKARRFQVKTEIEKS